MRDSGRDFRFIAATPAAVVVAHLVAPEVPRRLEADTTVTGLAFIAHLDVVITICVQIAISIAVAVSVGVAITIGVDVPVDISVTVGVRIDLLGQVDRCSASGQSQE